MDMYGLGPWEWALVVAAFTGSGLVRGFTGGIGANFLTAPVLSVLIGPRDAVPIIVLLTMIGNTQLLPQIVPRVRWKEGWAIFLFPLLTVPIGAWLLFSVDEDLMRRIIAGAAAAFSLLLLSGWRYRGPHMLGLSIATGSASGLLVGSISLGGPPVFLYLMAGSNDAATNRAQFVMFGTFAGLAAVFVFAVSGAFTLATVLFACLLLVPSILGVWIGARLFRHASEEVFRRVCLWGLVVVSLCVLVL